MRNPLEGEFPARVDLHVHSLYSDGLTPPRELCRLAERARLTHLALCDHDTLEGIVPMREAVEALNLRRREEGSPWRLCFLPGVELSAGFGGRTHVLGYGADPSNEVLQRTLTVAAVRRKERFGEMLKKLSRLGAEVPLQALPQDVRAPMGRAHLARALVQTGQVKTVTQAFDRFLAEGKPAYVPYEHLGAAQAVALLRQAGAVPVLAHPQRMKLEPQALYELVTSLKADGLMGLEVFHPSASRQMIRALEPFARRQGLLVTGGSDFHGDPMASARVGKLPSGWGAAQKDVGELLGCMTGSIY